MPINTYKNKAPHTGKVVSTKRIVGAQATGETCHIIIDTFSKMPYWEGQSAGVIAPGTNPKNGKPNSVRLYSIAASRYGDDMTGATTSLCVRRATYWCPELKADDPAKKGICSNFLCDSKPGDEVKLTGPSGKVMLIPEKTPNADLIMVRHARRTELLWRWGVEGGAHAMKRGRHLGPQVLWAQSPVSHDEAVPRALGAAPTAHATLLPAHTAAHHSPLILTQVATGTGIAPYRSFIRRLFVEKTPFAAVRT